MPPPYNQPYRRASTAGLTSTCIESHDRSAGSFASHPQKFIPTYLGTLSSPPTPPPPSRKHTIPIHPPVDHDRKDATTLVGEKKRRKKEIHAHLADFGEEKKERGGEGADALPASSIAKSDRRHPCISIDVPKTDFPGVDPKYIPR